MKYLKTKYAYPVRILALFIVVFLTFWLIPSNLVFAEGDTTKPVITLEGSTPVTVEVGSAYSDAGATALDNYNGDITSSIVTVNPVDANTVGSYTVTYNVTDANGNAALQVTRTVNVVDTPVP